MNQPEKDNKKGPDLSFFQKFNRPSAGFAPSSDSAWQLMKSRMKKVETEEGEKDGSDVFEEKDKEPEKPVRDGTDVFEVKKAEKELPVRDGRDIYRNPSVIQPLIPDKMDVFKKKEDEEKAGEGKKIDKWEKDSPFETLPGKDVLVRSDSITLSLPSDDTFISSSEGELYEVITEKASALHLQIIDLSCGLEKRTIVFERRENYIREIKNYIWRKKKSLERFSGLSDPRIKKVKFYLNRGFEVFSQSTGELEVYLRDDSPIHLILARQLSEEGNRMFRKAKDHMDFITGRKDNV